MDTRVYAIVLALEDIAGGWPGSVDKMRAFLQNPMMARRVPVEAQEEFIGQEREWGLPDNAESTPSDILRTGFRMVDGRPAIAAHQIKAMLQGAALALYDRTTQPTIYSVARNLKYGVTILPSLIALDGGEDGGSVTIQQIITHPRNETIKVPSTRERALWLGGTLSFDMHVLATAAPAKVLTESLLTDLLETGGMFVGLGTDRGYGHGRFTVSTFKAEGDSQADIRRPKKVRA